MDESKDLVNNLQEELVGIKTDLIILRYDIEQINSKLELIAQLLQTTPRSNMNQNTDWTVIENF